jgi:nucleotide-binding universal stress UspA family protein
VLLGRSLGSYIEGFALGPDIPDVYAMDVPVVVPPILDEAARREMAASARQLFESFMQEHHIQSALASRAASPSAGRGAPCRGKATPVTMAAPSTSLLSGRPSSRDTGPRLATLEEALFNSGRPVLVAPPLPPSAMGHNVVIAWNGSTETARAISFAMPILLKAKKVTVLTVKGGTVPGPAGEQIARTLRINGVSAQAVDVDDEGRSTGEAILRNAQEIGADFLVKGAYTQSRLRQMIFGGPTRYLLEHSTLPMLMAH